MRYVTHLGVLTHLSFPLCTNSILTPCKQGAVLSRYSIGLAMRINSLLTRCEQRAVHYLAMRTNSPAHFRNCPTTIFVRLKQIASETNISLFPKPSPSTTLVLDKISKKSARPFANNKITRKFALAKEAGAIAQLVEQRTENPCVPGSIPGGTTYKKPRSTPARLLVGRAKDWSC